MALINEITTTDEWKEILEESKARPVFIFKHSTRCGISANAFREYTKFVTDINNEDVKCYLVDIIKNRSLSNTISSETTLKHESPQLILIHNSLPVYNASHNRITKKTITENLKQHSIK